MEKYTTTVSEKYSNAAIHELLRCVAAAHLIRGDNRFKIIAYEKAADVVEHLTRELRVIWEEGKLADVPSIGATIAASLDEYFRTGTPTHFDSVIKKIPPPVFLLMKVPSIGPKKAFKLVTALKLEHADDIYAAIIKAADKNAIAPIETFGEKSQSDIREAITRYIENSHEVNRMPLPFAAEIAERVIAYLKELPAVKRVDVLGSLRRKVATIGDIDIAVLADENESEKIVKHFIQFPDTVHVDNVGAKKASIFVAGNRRIDMRVQSAESYGSMLQYFTGSKLHNIKLREYAIQMGYSLSEYGIKKIINNASSDLKLDSGRTALARMTEGEKQKILEFDTEEAFYAALNLPCIPPELREGTDEIENAKAGKLPKLLKTKDIKGDLHLHTSYDLSPSHDLGKNTYEEMIEKAVELGYEYIGFAEHNPKTSGLSEDEIVEIMRKRRYEFDSLMNEKQFPLKTFLGLEVDIQPNGMLALPEKAFEYVDYVIASVHSVFTLPIEEMTDRVIRALAHPKVKILGHPTGRLINRRTGFDLDWDTVFSFVSMHNIALEINAHPSRLDLPDSLVREGMAHSVKYIINTDSHAIDQMDLMEYGVSVARRGWCEKNDIINTKEYNNVREWLDKNF